MNASRAAHAVPRRILIADDDVAVALSLAIILRLAGYDVRTAHTGWEAFDEAEAFQPHVAVLDLGLPELDGFELARRIRSEPWGRDVSLLAFTGWAEPAHQAASADAGFDQYVLKPIDPVELLELLDRLIRESDAQDGLERAFLARG